VRNVSKKTLGRRSRRRNFFTSLKTSKISGFHGIRHQNYSLVARDVVYLFIYLWFIEVPDNWVTSLRHGVSPFAWRNGPQICEVDASIQDKKSRTSYKGCSSSLEVGRGPNNSSPLKPNGVTKHFTRSRTWTRIG
jgi:hypothetical protein